MYHQLKCHAKLEDLVGLPTKNAILRRSHLLLIFTNNKEFSFKTQPIPLELAVENTLFEYLGIVDDLLMPFL